MPARAALRAATECTLVFSRRRSEKDSEETRTAGTTISPPATNLSVSIILYDKSDVLDPSSHLETPASYGSLVSRRSVGSMASAQTL
jgi:hypothetical protein